MFTYTFELFCLSRSYTPLKEPDDDSTLIAYAVSDVFAANTDIVFPVIPTIIAAAAISIKFL